MRRRAKIWMYEQALLVALLALAARAQLRLLAASRQLSASTVVPVLLAAASTFAAQKMRSVASARGGRGRGRYGRDDCLPQGAGEMGVDRPGDRVRHIGGAVPDAAALADRRLRRALRAGLKAILPEKHPPQEAY